jgi:hypothetical protein
MDSTSSPTADLEVPLKSDPVRAIVEGKTAVSFQSFIGLVLQKKVLQLCKQWGSEPVIIRSELLTAIASAPQDNEDNRRHLLMVTLGSGIVLGLFFSTAVLLVLTLLSITLGVRELGIFLAGMAGVALLGWLLMNVQMRSIGEDVEETMEELSKFLK